MSTQGDAGRAPISDCGIERAPLRGCGRVLQGPEYRRLAPDTLRACDVHDDQPSAPCRATTPRLPAARAIAPEDDAPPATDQTGECSARARARHAAGRIRAAWQNSESLR